MEESIGKGIGRDKPLSINWWTMSSFQPMFLIAVPQMGDPNFSKSVVLMLHHDTDGAVGLVVNAPTPITYAQFAESQDFECHDGLKANLVFRGGPVQPERGWILHRDDAVVEKKPVLD